MTNLWQQWHLVYAPINILVLLGKITFFQSETWYGILSTHETIWKPLLLIIPLAPFLFFIFSHFWAKNRRFFYEGGFKNILIVLLYTIMFVVFKFLLFCYLCVNVLVLKSLSLSLPLSVFRIFCPQVIFLSLRRTFPVLPQTHHIHVDEQYNCITS